MKKKDLSVIFLMWVPYGIDYLISFINSYQNFNSGLEHDLVILYNGYGNEENIQPYKAFLKQCDIKHSYLLLKYGQDIAAYKWAAAKVDTEYVLFFNTYSQIQRTEWGINYLNAIKKSNVGCVGATGSWQSWSNVGFQKAKLFFNSESKIKNNIPYYNSKQINIGPFYIKIHPRLVLFGSLLKSLTVYDKFPNFPNPHLRTNAFIVSRQDWLNLELPEFKNKSEAHLFESGYNSFTRQIIKAGKKVLVMNKYGEVFEPHEWHISKTLWSSDQENLLVYDNFTEQYNNTPKTERIAFENFLWGKSR